MVSAPSQSPWEKTPHSTHPLGLRDHPPHTPSAQSQVSAVRTGFTPGHTRGAHTSPQRASHPAAAELETEPAVPAPGGPGVGGGSPSPGFCEKVPPPPARATKQSRAWQEPKPRFPTTWNQGGCRGPQNAGCSRLRPRGPETPSAAASSSHRVGTVSHDVGTFHRPDF